MLRVCFKMVTFPLTLTEAWAFFLSYLYPENLVGLLEGKLRLSLLQFLSQKLAQLKLPSSAALSNSIFVHCKLCLYLLSCPSSLGHATLPWVQFSDRYEKTWFLFKFLFFFWGWDCTIFTCWTRNQKLHVTFRYYQYLFSFSHVSITHSYLSLIENLFVCQNITTMFAFESAFKTFVQEDFSCPLKRYTSTFFFSVDFVILPLALGSLNHLVSRNNSVLFFSIEWASFPSGIYETVHPSPFDLWYIEFPFI